ALLEHAAGFHGSDADLLEKLVPLTEAALGRGEPVATALRPTTAAALADRLGLGGCSGDGHSGDGHSGDGHSGDGRSADGHGGAGRIVALRAASADLTASGQTVAARWALELR